MAINFPDSPSIDEEFTVGTNTWIWTGSAWVVKNTLSNIVLTGTPTTPTPTAGDSSEQVANTAFVQGEIAALVDSAPSTLDTLNELSAALNDDANFAGTITNAIATKANANDFLETSNFEGTIGSGWFTIAVNPGDRASAQFAIYESRSSYHQAVHFYASHHFGSGNVIKVLNNDSFSGGGSYRYIRIKQGGTYDGAMLQVYNDIGSTPTKLWMFQNAHSSGWTLKNFIPDGTDPGGLNNFSAITTVAAEIDLDSTQVRNTTISTSAPSGGSNGDIWLVYTA